MVLCEVGYVVGYVVWRREVERATWVGWYSGSDPG